MVTILKSWINIKPWLAGILLSAAAMFLGWELGSGAANILGGEPKLIAQIGKGFVWGAIIGGLQWFSFRIAGAHIISMLAASAIGFAIGYPLKEIIPPFFSLGVRSTLVYGSALILFGLSLGVPQWWVIRNHVKRAGLWILFSVIAWIFTGIAWNSFGVNSGVDALLYGIIAGSGLVWLVHSKQLRKTS